MEKNYFVMYTNKAMVTIYHDDGSCKITWTARGGASSDNNKTNINFEILVGGWARYSDDTISEQGRATNVKVISPTNIKMLSAGSSWSREDSGNHFLIVNLNNLGSSEEEVYYDFYGTN